MIRLSSLKKLLNIAWLFVVLVFFSCKELFDVIPPELDIIQPANNENVARTFDVVLDVDDNDEIESVQIELLHLQDYTWISIDDKTLDIRPWRHTFSLSLSGRFRLIVLAKDMVGNFKEKDRSFNVYTESGEKTYYLNEDWEGSDYSGWLTGHSGSSSWVVTDTESYQGNKSAMSGSVSDANESSFIYYELDTPSNGYLRVIYHMWVECEGSGSAHVYLEVQGNNSSSWNELFHLTGQSSYGWSEYSSMINLNSIATPPKLQWRIEGDWGDCSCYVDNIKVYQE